MKCRDRKFRRILCFLVLATAVPAAASRVPSPLLTDWRFQPGDNMDWAAADLDDGHWRKVTPPSLERLPWIRPRGWFRCTFELPDTELDAAAKLGVCLGRIESADEAYLNGRRVGGEGLVGDAFWEAPRKLRVYLLPNESLRQTNTLAVRVQNSYPSGGLAGLPELGDFGELLLRQRTLESRQKAIDAFLLGIMATLALFLFVLRSRGLRQPEVRPLLQLALLLGGIFVFESPLLQALGWMSPIVGRIYMATSLALPVPVLGLAAGLADGKRLRQWIDWTRVGALALAGFYLFFGRLSICSAVHTAWVVLLLATFVFFFVAWRNPRGGHRVGLKSLGFGLVVLGVAGLADFGLGLLASPWSRAPLHWACGVFVVVVMLDLSSRFVRLQQTLHALSQRLLTSREDEAKRISRDLHDGLGQALVATKLNLQCIRHQQPADARELKGTLDALIQETSRNIDLLQRTVRNLRPASLTELGFGAAMRELGTVGEDPQAPCFRFDVDDAIHCPPEIEDNLYRIAQEAVGNALKHAGCQTIWIRVARDSGWVRVQIEDDGIGFDWNAVEKAGTGIGLVAMRERLVPFGGKLVIRTEVGTGTTIIAEVPNP